MRGFKRVFLLIILGLLTAVSLGGLLFPDLVKGLMR